MEEMVASEMPKDSIEVVKDAKGLHKFTIKFYFDRKVDEPRHVVGELAATMGSLVSVFPNGG